MGTQLYSHRLPCFVGASFLLWTLWVIFLGGPHPLGDLSNGQYTDHLSHLNCSRLFPRVGLDLWRKPIDSMFTGLTAQQREGLPNDINMGSSDTGGIFTVPGWPESKPLAVGWSHQPRFYPPGDLLLFGPVALLYSQTSLSTKAANRLAIIICLACAHLSIYFFFDAILANSSSGSGMSLVTLFVICSVSLKWALEGFFDQSAVVPLLLSARALERNRGSDALLAYSVAIFMHYRAFVFFPVAVAGAMVTFRNREWRGWALFDWIKLAATAFFCGASLFTFAMVWPWISASPITNPICVEKMFLHPGLIYSFLIVYVAATAALMFADAWFDAFTLGFLALFLITVRDVRQWHMLIPMAWLGFPMIGIGTIRSNRFDLILAIRLIVLWFVAASVYDSQLVPIWLRQLAD